MAPYPPDTISRQDGINPWGLIAAVLIFVSASVAFSWIGLRSVSNRLGAENDFSDASQFYSQNLPEDVSQSEALSEVEDEYVEAAVPDVDSPGASATTSEIPDKQKLYPAKTAEKPAEKKQMEPSPVKKKNVASAASSTTEKTTKTEVAISSGTASSRPSALVTNRDIEKRADTGIPANVEKVSKKSVSSGPVEWYAVQVGYTDSKDRANVLRDVLIQQGYLEAKTVGDKDGYFYVSVGKYQFRYEADLASKSVSEKTGLTPRIYEKTIAN